MIFVDKIFVDKKSVSIMNRSQISVLSFNKYKSKEKTDDDNNRFTRNKRNFSYN